MKRTSIRAVVGLTAAMLIAGGASPTQAASVVNVSLWDKGATMPMAVGLAYATPSVDTAKATMGIKVSPPEVKAGKVTFNVKNDSKDRVHEMIVIHLANPGRQLPYINAQNRVDEDKAGDKGEVSDLKPGVSGTLNVNLKAGKYLLICNQQGHFAAGMWTELTVDP
ncbi:sulfocyanin-like copper-binding protein [Mesorhizobium sp. VK24D]|uniref:Sulfocyanin-like copper-binding protein n=1 Tax=Mesorhizobium album TaxID=3072314 RepID=A0ABU4Y3B5_9HYPH|nr:sulfocyanin-like copper-binding protein [Mesorhizobium sp. VK24D]MDX8480397.1 sulfocyanin-like copper-binding protein [Mesorhizobium sp. VK24D]